MSIRLISTVATVFGSYLVIRAFHKFHSLRTASNVVLVSLSTADGLLVIPLIFGIVQMSLRLLNGSDAECSSGPLGKITSTSSFFLISRHNSLPRVDKRRTFNRREVRLKIPHHGVQSSSIDRCLGDVVFCCDRYGYDDFCNDTCGKQWRH